MSEKNSYQKYYGINPGNLDNYDFVLDTTDLTPEEFLEKNLDFIERVRAKN